MDVDYLFLKANFFSNNYGIALMSKKMKMDCHHFFEKTNLVVQPNHHTVCKEAANLQP